MSMKTRFLAVAGVLMMAASGLASAQPAPAAAYTQNGFDPQILDAGAPKAERMQRFAQVVAQANAGQVRAQDLAGTLYWQGSNIQGSPVDRNLDLARKLLANAAIHGDVLAMAKLSELELAAGRTLQAMIWAQMYARYLDPMAQERSRRGHEAAYASSLIKRIVDAGGKIDTTVSHDVAAMVGHFDTSIRDGIRALYAESRNGHTHLIDPPMPKGMDSNEIANLNGVAEYMIEFDPSGTPHRVWPLESFPQPDLTTTLRDYLDKVRANTADSGSGMRYLRVWITHNASKFRELRPTH